jgi:transcriptional regulator with XRE-family HTH domain
MSQALASNLKRIREVLAWTQEALAEAAAVDVRTVQRAEAGKGISAESLRSFAGALDVPIHTLQTRIPSDEEVSRLAAAWNERYSLVPLTIVDDAETLRDFFGDSCAMHFKTYGLETHEQEQAAAILQETLTDCGLLWPDLSPTDRLSWWGFVAEHLQAARDLGLVVTAGHEILRLRPNGVGDRTPMTWGNFYVMVTKQNEPKLYALRDKSAPLF